MERSDYLIQAITNTAPSFLKGAIDLTARNYFILSWVLEHGRVLTNASGYDLNWNVTAREPEIHTTRGQRQEFVASDTEEQLTINHAKLRGSEVLDEDTLLVNDGQAAIVKLADRKVKGLADSMCRRMNGQFYNDDQIDPNGCTGLLSLFRPLVGAATDLMAVPQVGSTYGGRAMHLGALGGRWDANLGPARKNTAILEDWPDGSGDSEFDYLSPKMFNYSGSWSTGTNNWQTNCEKVLRRSCLYIDHLGGKGAAPMLALMGPSLAAELRDKLEEKDRLRPSDYADKVGLPGRLLEYEDMVISTDFHCPTDRAYCINSEMMELYTLTPDLFWLDGPEWSIRDEAYLMALKFKGNFRWKPKYFSELGSYS